jgi:hypothetical protein
MLLAGLLLFASYSQAAKRPKRNKRNHIPAVSTNAPSNLHFTLNNQTTSLVNQMYMNSKALWKKSKKRKDIKRRYSSVDGKALDQDRVFTYLRKRFLSISNAEGIRSLVTDAYKKVRACTNNRYQGDACLKTKLGDGSLVEDSYEAKFFYTQLAGLYPLEGFLYRIRDYVEEFRAPHAASLTLVRNFAVFTHVMSSNEQADHIFAFLSEPSERTANNTIPNDASLQKFVNDEVLPLTVESQSYFHQIKEGFERGLLWDNRIITGTNSIGNRAIRFAKGDIGDFNAMMAAYASFIGGLNLSLAYDWSNLLDISKDLGFLVGIESVTSRLGNIVRNGPNSTNIQGAPASKRTAIIKKYPKFLTKRSSLSDSEWKAYLLNAYHSIQATASYAAEAWKDVKGRTRQDRPFTLFHLIEPYGNLVDQGARVLNAQVMENREVYTFNSQIDNKVVKFNARDYFVNNPPRDLKAFLPTGFVGGDKESNTRFKNGRKTIKKRNYLWGSANSWNVGEYGKYFPGVNSNAKLKQTMRSFSQTYGGFMFGGFLLPTI